MTTPEQRQKIREEYNSKTNLDWGVIYPSGKFEVGYVLYLEQQLAEARRERDLAVAHDRQPYPTAYAYDRVCAALHKKEELLSAAEQKAREFAQAVLKSEKVRNDLCPLCNSPFLYHNDDCKILEAQAYLTQTKGEQSDA